MPVSRKGKIRYEIDPHNRLIFAGTGKESKVPGYREILEGRFKIDKNNYLTYHLKKSSGSKEPQQLKLSGNWSLSRDHNLVLTLDKWNKQYAGNKLTLKGELTDIKANALSFAIATRDSRGKSRVRILKLGGTWQADRYNRLTFKATKEKGLTDILTLKGGWEMDKRNRVIYAYTKSQLRKKEKVTKTITFQGFWEITEQRRVSYILNKGRGSRFDFKVSLGKPVKRGLEYEISIGAVPEKKTLTLSGKWKANKRLGLLFEMPYEKGKVENLIFGASCRLDEDHNLAFKLKNKAGKDLGIEIKLSGKILKDQGEVFLRALTSRKEVSFTAGVGFRW